MSYNKGLLSRKLVRVNDLEDKNYCSQDNNKKTYRRKGIFGEIANNKLG